MLLSIFAKLEPTRTVWLKNNHLNSRLINVDIYVGDQWVIVVYGNFSAISRREQVNFQRDEDEVPTHLVGFFL